MTPRQMNSKCDVAVIGAGMSGMTSALLLANEGIDVVLIEAHSEPGGCAGFFRRGPFSFDVGATTFISFQEGGIGAAAGQERICAYQPMVISKKPSNSRRRCSV